MDEKKLKLKEDFIRKAKEKWGETTYDYSLVDYVNNKTKVEIVCKEHGSFWIRPNNHLSDQGCPRCSRKHMGEKIALTTSKFIERAKAVHGDRYDYSKVDYKRSNNPVTIICPIHGEFQQKPAAHLSGHGCNICNPPKTLSSHEEFVAKMQTQHPNLEIISRYINSRSPITVRCKTHVHTFETTPKRLVAGQNCQKCYDERRGDTIRLDLETIKERLREVHGDTYEYPNIDDEYLNSKSKITCICKKHGSFENTIGHLTNGGQGCPQCAHDENGFNKRLTTEEFIAKSKLIQGDKYDYSKVEYKTSNDEVCIICPEHGEFWQVAAIHLVGSGCPQCNESTMEKFVAAQLERLNVEFEREVSFDCIGNKRADFYLPKQNLVIECQCDQHFVPVDFFGGEETFSSQLQRDIDKFKELTKDEFNVLYIVNDNMLEETKSEIFCGIYSKDNTISLTEFEEKLDKILLI